MADSRATQARVDVALAGLVHAQALHAAVRDDPAAPLAVSIVGPGGSGKSALLGALREAYLAAGVQVVGADAVAVGLQHPPEVAVLVDDAHELAGPDLERLCRLALGGDVRLAVAYRPWPRRPELDTLAGTLHRCRPPVLLGRLDRAGIAFRAAALLETTPSAALLDLLCEQTGGVPLHVDLVIGALRCGSGGDLGTGIPRDVVERLSYDLSRLPAPLRALLLAVACGGAPDPEILAQVLAVDPAAVPDRLAEAQAAGLLLGDGTLAPLVRSAILGSTPADARCATQRLVLSAHARCGRPVLDLARDLVGAGARGDDLAAVLEAAGDAALSEPAGSDAPARAARLYTQAVAAGAPVAALAARRAEAAALAGDLDGALRFADQVLSAASPGTSGNGRGADLARAGTVAAAVLAHRGMLARSAEVYRWVGTSRVAATGMGSTRMGPTRMGSMAPLAALALLGTGSLAAAREVLGADQDRPPTLLAGAESLLAAGVHASVVGSPTEALSMLTRAAALLEPGGAPVLLPDTPAALAAIVALHSGELDVAVSVLQRALAAGAGGALARPRYQLLLGWTAMVRGDTVLARQWLEATVPASGALEPREELLATALAVGLARRAGDIPALQTAWAAAREAIVRQPVDLFALLPLGELAVAAARLRDFGRVAPHLEQARLLLERLGDPPLWTTPLHWYELHAAILRDQPAVAETHAAALVKAAASSHYAAVLAAAGRAWMQVLAGQVEPGAVESAARGLTSIGLANDGSRLAGQAAIRTTDRKAMITLLGCARALQASGPGAAGAARPDEPGAAPVPTAAAAAPARAPTPLLSSRELEVAKLVLVGLTYRQIGERLFISAKTVEHHVARIRQRLDVTTRDELFSQLRSLVSDQLF